MLAMKLSAIPNPWTAAPTPTCSRLGPEMKGRGARRRKARLMTELPTPRTGRQLVPVSRSLPVRGATTE